jgi:pimeloyl-ACP methyl ester carboxylesterase
MPNSIDTARSSVRLRGGEVEVVRLSPPERRDGPTLVFLHEGLGSADLWRDFPARMVERTGCPALLYSRFGYGRSDAITLPRPLHYMHDEALDVLPELLERASIADHILIGHSDGATIALINAARAPAPSLLGVVSEASHVFCEPITVASIERARIDFVQGRLRDALLKHHGDNTDGAFFGWCDAWLDPGFRAWDIRAELAAIQVPVFALQGSDDEYGSHAQLEAIAQRIPSGARIRTFERCGHAPHRDQPHLTLDAMASFVEDIRRASRPARDSLAK